MHQPVIAIVAAVTMLASAPLRAAEPPIRPVGETELVERSALRQPAQTTVETPLIEKETLFTRDTVTTETKASVLLKFRDETELRLGENSQVKLDDFLYRETSADRMVLSVAKGAARFITGKIQRNKVSIFTPVVQIGVRGTDFTMKVEADGGTTLSVIEGQIEISTAGGVSQLVDAGETVAISAGGEAVRPAATPCPDPGLMMDTPFDPLRMSQDAFKTGAPA